MKIILGKRRTGKTTKLIEICAKDGGYIVTDSQQSAFRITHLANEMGLNINFPITYGEFITGRYGSGVIQFHIDNVDLLLKHISRYPVKTITITDDIEQVKE